jgi:hypothetical protein
VRTYDSAGLAVSSTYFLESKVWVTSSTFIMYCIGFVSFPVILLTCFVELCSIQWYIIIEYIVRHLCHAKDRNLWSGSFWYCSNSSIVLKFIPLSLCGFDRNLSLQLFFALHWPFPGPYTSGSYVHQADLLKKYLENICIINYDILSNSSIVLHSSLYIKYRSLNFINPHHTILWVRISHNVLEHL